jgi:hypothetical protein
VLANRKDLLQLPRGSPVLDADDILTWTRREMRLTVFTWSGRFSVFQTHSSWGAGFLKDPPPRSVSPRL